MCVKRIGGAAKLNQHMVRVGERRIGKENFFSVLTRRAIRRGVFKSVPDLQDTIRTYIRRHNDDPTPFVWTKPAETILAKLRRLPDPSD
jgi:uncharacterized protein YbcV (DUF1398 family)